MRRELERLEGLVKYNDFVFVLEEWKQEFERLCSMLDSSIDVDRIGRACGVLKKAHGVILAEEYFHNVLDRSKVEKSALFVLISDVVMSEVLCKGKTKEEVLEEIGSYVKERKNGKEG
jgi:hypothetical protein